MDTSNPVLSGLVRKRQEIENELNAAQARVRQLVHDIDALDATIRLFAPDIDLAGVKVRPTPRRHEMHRGDTSRLILELLREPGEPLTLREITCGLCGIGGSTWPTRRLPRSCGLGLARPSKECGSAVGYYQVRAEDRKIGSEVEFGWSADWAGHSAELTPTKRTFA